VINFDKKIRIRNVGSLLAISLIVVGSNWNALALANSSVSHPGIIRAFTKADTPAFSIIEDTLRCPVVERLSPDKKYVARIVLGDGEVGQLYIGHAIRGGRKDFRGRFLFTLQDVNGCLWLPVHRHSLAYSSGVADYGRGYLGVWNGKNHIIIRAQSEVDEGYDITSFDPAKDKLSYDYLPPEMSSQRQHKLMSFKPYDLR
jgi:hypothetical protein